MHSSVETLLLYLCLITSFSCWSSASFAFVASDMRVIVVSPFLYSEDGVPQNVKEEMAIDVDLPQETADYFKSVNAFKSVALSKSGSDLQSEADLFVHGEILYVQGGNGAARYFGSLGGAGRASMLIGIKVFNAQGQLLHEGRVTQEGTAATNIVTAWSNKKNLTSTLKALPQKILPTAIAGDLETPEGVVRALESRNALAMRAAARSSHTHGLFKNKNVTDAMETFVLQNMKNSDADGNLIDGMAWCLINIGESLDIKYTASLVKIIDSKVPNKIKKHAKNALNNITKANK
jgi:hypothetical protein